MIYSVIDNEYYLETKYVVENQLGSGGFGTVFAAYRKEDQLPVSFFIHNQAYFNMI